MTRLAYYRAMARRFAALAARNRWMRRDISHELWAERALAALMMMRWQLAVEAETSSHPVE